MVHVNSALRIRHEQKKMQGVVEKLDIYMPVEPVNDEVEKVSVFQIMSSDIIN